MWDRRVFFGVIIIVITAGILGLLLGLPGQSLGCVSNDGQCPKGCTYDKDTDCIRSTVTTGGEIRRCFTDSNCVVVKPICGNERCNFNDIECQSSCACAIAINSDYKSVFEANDVKCLPSGETCAECAGSSKAICINGECRATIN